MLSKFNNNVVMKYMDFIKSDSLTSIENEIKFDISINCNNSEIYEWIKYHYLWLLVYIKKYKQ